MHDQSVRWKHRRLRVLTFATAVVAVAVAALVWVPGPARARRSLHPIELCWFPTADRDTYVITNAEINEHILDPLTHEEARLTNTQGSGQEWMLFCPFMDDDLLLSHSDALTVNLQGTATSDWRITGQACVDDPLSILTRCTEPVSDTGSTGAIGFQIDVVDTNDLGWIDTSSTEDRTHWYPYLVYTLESENEASGIFLTGYRIED